MWLLTQQIFLAYVVDDIGKEQIDHHKAGSNDDHHLVRGGVHIHGASRIHRPRIHLEVLQDIAEQGIIAIACAQLIQDGGEPHEDALGQEIDEELDAADVQGVPQPLAMEERHCLVPNETHCIEEAMDIGQTGTTTLQSHFLDRIFSGIFAGVLGKDGAQDFQRLIAMSLDEQIFGCLGKSADPHEGQQGNRDVGQEQNAPGREAHAKDNGLDAQR